MHRPGRHARRSSRWLALAFALLVFSGAVSVAVIHWIGVPPRLLAPYIERRSSGHNPLIEEAGRQLAAALIAVDRGRLEPRLFFPPWALPPAAIAPKQLFAHEILIASAAELRKALARVEPGDVLTLLPGIHRFDGRNLLAQRAGQRDAPITVRAPQAGDVVLEFNLLEGFIVSAPHWVFENLKIVGTCPSDNSCEHAFHVVGAAQHTVIRNNEIREFNAHIKVNGAEGRFPDHGAVLANRIYNTRARHTTNAVTPFDLVAASDWRVEGNLIADFVKAGGDMISYGAFAKGGGSGNSFVRNVVLCEHRLRGSAGRRVGLSFGGGGSAAAFCRDRRCVVEHERGRMHDNLIASCSDDGIYVNRSAQSDILGNTLIDTAGVNLRFAETSAGLAGNLVDGPIRANGGALLYLGDNRSTWLTASYLGAGAVRRAFVDALALDLRWRGDAPRRSVADPSPDLCGTPRPAAPAYGAFEDLMRCIPGAR